MTKHSLKAALLLTLFSTFLSSCDNTKVSVYETKKALRPQLNDSNLQQSSRNGESKLSWTPPLSWQILDGTALSKNRYEAKNEFGHVTISVSAVPRSTTIVRQNSSLLTKQIGIANLSIQEINKLTKLKSYSNLNASEILLTNIDKNLSVKNVSIPMSDRIWNFTMKGSTQAVTGENSRFTSLLNSLRIVNQNGVQTENNSLSTFNKTIDFVAPEDWIENEPSPLRVASYSIKRLGIKPADFSVLRFEKSESNLLSNINRWRRQIGMSNWTQQRLEQRTRTINTTTLSFRTFDLKAETADESENSNERIFLALLEDNGSVYYLKLRGDALLLETQRRNFINLLNSVSIKPIHRINNLER